MKTFKQFIEAPKKPKPKGSSKPSAAELIKIKHSREKDHLADKGKLDKEKQSTEFKQMVSQQKSEKERAKAADKSARLRKATADKRKKQQVKKK